MEIDPRKILAKLVEKNIIDPQNATKFEADAVAKKIPLEQYLLVLQGSIAS